MIYCVVPEALESELFDKLTAYYADDENVTVIVDRRKSERRGPNDDPASNSKNPTITHRHRALCILIPSLITTAVQQQTEIRMRSKSGGYEFRLRELWCPIGRRASPSVPLVHAWVAKHSMRTLAMSHQ